MTTTGRRVRGRGRKALHAAPHGRARPEDIAFVRAFNATGDYQRQGPEEGQCASPRLTAMLSPPDSRSAATLLTHDPSSGNATPPPPTDLFPGHSGFEGSAASRDRQRRLLERVCSAHGFVHRLSDSAQGSYRYFLNVAAAMHTATPSNVALGNRISSGSRRPAMRVSHPRQHGQRDQAGPWRGDR